MAKGVTLICPNCQRPTGHLLAYRQEREPCGVRYVQGHRICLECQSEYPKPGETQSCQCNQCRSINNPRE